MGNYCILVLFLVVLSKTEALNTTEVVIDGNRFLEFRKVKSATEFQTYLDEITSEYIPVDSSSVYINSIKRISINSSSLTEVPTGVFFRFKNVIELRAENVGLEIFEGKSVAINIGDLRLPNNKLKYFGYAKLPGLKNLDLSGNELEIIDLTNSGAVTINLSRNKLKEVAISKEVAHLNIEGNQIEKIVTRENSSLKVLKLSRNLLKTEDLLNLRDLQNLTTLELSECGLTSLNVDSFAHLESLVTLKLDKNFISKIGFGVFAHQKMLQTLNLSSNALINIDLHHFEALTSLTSLDISYNNISSLDGYENLRKIFFKNLTEIDVEGNLWDCKYLGNLTRSLQSQLIKVKTPRNSIKNRSNIQGIECTENSSEAVTKIVSKIDISEKITEMQLKLNGVEESLGTMSRWLTFAYMIIIICAAIVVYKIVNNTFASKRVLRGCQSDSTNPFEQRQLNDC